MAVLLSKATGNFLDTNGWNSTEAGANSVQLTRSSSTNTTTSYVYSSLFTVTTAHVIDGFLLFCKRQNTTGTVTVALSQDSGTTDTLNVTVNASDLPVNAAWVFFKFGSTLTGLGTNTYKVGIKGSSAGNATFNRDGTAGNWSHLLRQTATVTIATSDNVYIAKELTGAGSNNAVTYTMDETNSAHQYGAGTDISADNGIEVCFGGVLSYGIAGSTNYYLKLFGTINVWDSGTFNIGSSGSEMPRTSTATLEINCTAAGGNGILCQDGGNFNTAGLSRTSGKDIVHCSLNTDEAANSTSLGVDTDTGWLDNDEIAVFATTRTGSQTEKGTLNGDAGSSTLTVDGFAGTAGGLLNAHGGGGTTNVIAEVVLVTRNVLIKSTSSGNLAYMDFTAASNVSCSWTQFKQLGTTTTTKCTHSVRTTTGSYSVSYCHFGENTGQSGARTISMTGSSGNNLTVQHCTAFLTAGLVANTSTSQVNVFDDNWFHIQVSSASVNGFQLADSGCTFTNNHVVCEGQTSGSGIILQENAVLGTFSGNVSHSGGIGLNVAGNLTSGTISSCSSWRGNSYGFTFTGVNVNYIQITGLLCFGNTTAQIELNALSTFSGLIVFSGSTFYSEASFTTTSAVRQESTTLVEIIFINCSMDGSTVHTNLVFLNNGAGNTFVRLIFQKCTLNPTNRISTVANFIPNSYVKIHNPAGPEFSCYSLYGISQADTSTRHTASGYSWKLTPNNASNKLVYPGPHIFDTLKIPVTSGVTYSVSCYLRKDGTYNGNQPRLVALGGIVAGIGSWGTNVTSAMTGGASAWEQVTVSLTPSEDGVAELYVDCDGTAGNAFVDDFAVA